jgi:hypothetical protein
MSMATSAVVRDVEIAALSPRTELAAVVRAAVAIAFGVWLYLANQPSAAERGASGDRARNLLPFQTLIQNRSVDEQRRFRTLQVALIEAENLRSTSGRWPEVTEMAEQGIEPFAVNPTDKGARYTWQLQRSGLYVNYLGIPDQADAPAWLILVQEPDPSLPTEPYQNDEEHARLVDGTLLHVSIWQHANGPRVPLAVVRVPQAEGWTQLFAVGPSTGP